MQSSIPRSDISAPNPALPLQRKPQIRTDQPIHFAAHQNIDPKSRTSQRPIAPLTIRSQCLMDLNLSRIDESAQSHLHR